MGRWHRSLHRDKLRFASTVDSFGRQRILLAIYIYCILATFWFNYMYNDLGSDPQSPEAEKNGRNNDTSTKKTLNEEKQKAMDPLSSEVFGNLTAERKQNQRTYLRTLREFDSIWRLKLGHTYHLYCGTLLGATRHQGFIPYDDSIDLIADRKDMPSMTTAFRGTPLNVHLDGKGKRKVFLKEEISKVRKNWLDVSFYKFLRNDSEIQDPELPSYHLPTALVFPTRLLPFEGFSFPAPRCYYRALEAVFGLDFLNKCCPALWRRRAGPCTDCQRVFQFFNVSLTPLARETEEICRV